jgi:hypothetical protein
LEEGFDALADEGLISRDKIAFDPRTNRRFDSPRVRYTNGFTKHNQTVERLAPASYEGQTLEATDD